MSKEPCHSKAWFFHFVAQWCFRIIEIFSFASVGIKWKKKGVKVELKDTKDIVMSLIESSYEINDKMDKLKFKLNFNWMLLIGSK